MSWLFPRRVTEASAEQLVAAGAVGGYGVDPIDGDRGFVPAGTAGREVPWWTLERARMYGVAAYRMNPMARAILDTYTSFCVGDSGLTLQCAAPDVREIAEEFWADPANAFADQELMLRSAMLMGERADEMMVGDSTGIVRRSVIDPTRIEGIGLRDGNPLRPALLALRQPGGDPDFRSIVEIDDITGRRGGQVMFGRWWRTTEFDQRGYPFLGPVLDWLDSYDNVLANLIDRTALARYLTWDVTVDGSQADVDRFIASRGGRSAPKSGTVEVHNEKVKWESKTAQVGAYEDRTTAQSVLTSVAAGSGLAKTWLAEPEDANRATSLTMGEPVRRRVGGVQNLWLAYMTEHVRYAVDKAVEAGRLPETVTLPDGTVMAAARAVTMTGPEIADAPALTGAEVLLKLTTALAGLRQQKLLSPKAAELAARKGWEDFTGTAFRPELAVEDADVGDIATYLDDQGTAGLMNQLTGI